MTKSTVGEETKQVPSLDAAIFIPSGFVVLVVGVSLVVFPEQSGEIASNWMSMITANFGWLFSLVAFLTLIFCLWLALGRFGQV